MRSDAGVEHEGTEERSRRRISGPIGWSLVVFGFLLWLGLAVVQWFRAELTLEWLAASGIGAGVLTLGAGVAREQYRDWKNTRYKDVQR